MPHKFDKLFVGSNLFDCWSIAFSQHIHTYERQVASDKILRTSKRSFVDTAMQGDQPIRIISESRSGIRAQLYLRIPRHHSRSIVGHFNGGNVVGDYAKALGLTCSSKRRLAPSGMTEERHRGA